MGRNAVDMLGKRFGRLIVLRRGPYRAQGGGQARWICRCDCGKEFTAQGARLRAKNTRSCGCYRVDRAGQRFRTHGKSKTMQYCMFYDARKRALKLNLPFSIEPEDIVIPEVCPVLGVTLDCSSREVTPSLDRKVPSLDIQRRTA